MRRILVTLVAAMLVSPSMAADSIEVSVSQLGTDQYQLAMELPAAVDPQQASSMLFPVAEQLCAGRPVQLGRYRFESHKPLAPGADITATQRFTQEVACGTSSEVVHVARAPKTPPTAQDEQTIRANTLRYLEAKA